MLKELTKIGCVSDTGTPMFCSREKLSILVDGYICLVVYDNERHCIYEESLSLLIVEYLSLREYFEHYNTEKIRVNEARDTIIKLTDGLACSYGVIKIPSLEKFIHRWTFKVHAQNSFTAIGIDETKYLRKDTGFDDIMQRQSKAYG